MTDIQKNTLINEIHNVCDALSGLEDAGHDAGSVLQSQARDMIDALEQHLRTLTPEAYR